jgi:hypothetical protein
MSYRCNLPTLFGSERESVKCPIWRRLERLRLAAEQRFARQPLFSEPQIQRWRPVWWGRTFYVRSRNWKESSHPIDSSWVGSPARLIAGTLGGTGIPHRVFWLGRSVPTKAAGIPWLPNGENRSIPRRLKNPECCHQTRPLSPKTLRPGRPSLASQSTRTKPFKPEPNERTSLYSFLRRAHFSSRRSPHGSSANAIFGRMHGKPRCEYGPSLTALLRSWSRGDQTALERLAPPLPPPTWCFRTDTATLKLPQRERLGYSTTWRSLP